MDDLQSAIYDPRKVSAPEEGGEQGLASLAPRFLAEDAWKLCRNSLHRNQRR